MKSEQQLIFWDSSVIIDAIQKTPGRYEEIEPLIHKAENGNLKIVISEVSVAEVCYLKQKKREGLPLAKQIEFIRNWFDNEYIVRRIVSPGVSELASGYALYHNITPLDAIIAATAAFYQIQTLHTYDAVLAKRTKSKKNTLADLDGLIGDPPIRIGPPGFESTTS